MEKHIKIGILGAANIAIRSVIPAIQYLTSHYLLAGIATRSVDAAQNKLATLNTVILHGYDALLDNTSIDAVYIPLPNALHAEWIEKALLKQKHVLVEKSLGISLEEVIRLTNLARERNLVLVENFQFRFHPQLEFIRDIVTSHQIGDIRSLRSSFGFPPFPDADNIRYKKELGGGALLDAGAYTTKISQLILGEGLEVKSATLNYSELNQVDIWGGAYLQEKSRGIFAQLAFGFDHFYQCGIEIWGSKGKLSTNRLFTAPAGYEPEILLETGKGKEILKAPSVNHFEQMLIHFYQLICTQKGVEKEHAQNIDQARLLNEIKSFANV